MVSVNLRSVRRLRRLERLAAALDRRVASWCEEGVDGRWLKAVARR